MANNNHMTVAAATARNWIEQNPLFLDTETTGLDDRAEIIEIAILNLDGKPLVNTLIRPLGRITEDAYAVHGINHATVARSPIFRHVWPQIKQTLEHRVVFVWNHPFDFRLLGQTIHKTGDGLADTLPQIHALDTARPVCAKRLYAQFFGEWNTDRQEYRGQNLDKAAFCCGVNLPERIHRAAADAELMRQVVLHMAEQKETP